MPDAAARSVQLPARRRQHLLRGQQSEQTIDLAGPRGDAKHIRLRPTGQNPTRATN